MFKDAMLKIPCSVKRVLVKPLTKTSNFIGGLITLSSSVTNLKLIHKTGFCFKTVLEVKNTDGDSLAQTCLTYAVALLRVTWPSCITAL